MNVSMREQPVILVTGVSGQVGFELVRALQGLGRVVGLDRASLDIADTGRIAGLVADLRPALIVNPAAYTAVDKAESDVAAATRLNVDAPRAFAEAAACIGATLIHYSTDYVFDGTKATPYTEDDAANPQNVYGRSKLEGELAIAATGCAHLILRTSWVYGMRGKNFLLTMLRLGAERPELKVVADQVGAPTWSNTIAAATAHIVAQGMAGGSAEWWQQRSGVYHLTAAGETSWHGFAQAIFDIAMPVGGPRVLPIPASDYPTPATRPTNSRLSNEKLAACFGVRQPDWREALALSLAK
jgi:dTDP-4-dehydrorhamnose reductase